MTRLLKTPIVARAGTASISSCIDRLGGESMACTLRMPPDFCAKLGTMPNADTTSAAAANARRPRYILRPLPLQPTLGGALFRALAQGVRGALGIFTPHVDTAAEAREVVNRLKARNAVAWRRKGGSVGVPIGGDRDPPRMPQCVRLIR